MLNHNEAVLYYVIRVGNHTLELINKNLEDKLTWNESEFWRFNLHTTDRHLL